MSNFLGAKSFGPLLISCALFAGFIATPTANASSAPNSTPTADLLFDSQVVGSPEPLGRVERDSVKAARAQLIKNAVEWGIQPTQFQPKITTDGVAGMSVVRFQQSVRGIEVANSLLAITVDKDGSLLSYTKSMSDYSGGSQAAISQTEAKDLLKLKLAQEFGISPDQVMVSQIQLVIVDGALVDEVPNGKYLAWRASTSVMNDATSISMTYLSQDGKQVLSTLPLVRKITAEPFVCDLQTDAIPLPTGVTVDSNQDRYLDVSRQRLGLPLCGVNTSGRIMDLDNSASVNIKRTWNYFSSVLGQDINEEKYLGNVSEKFNDDLTPRISAFINVCATNGTNSWCPYGNAFWVPWVSNDCASGLCSGIFFGRYFDRSDDVIAHELAHGVTSALAFYGAYTDQSEPAALSEAISDIFGEAMDQLDVQPGELADPDWKMGEDVTPGGFRSLKTPDKAVRIDKNWKAIDGSHDNNGPVNRLAFLLANGGSVGKVNLAALGSTANTVTRNDLCDSPNECLGTIRMSQLVFETTKNLTATASYFEFGRAMNNACFTLLKAKATGFTTSSCKTVQSALIAQGFTDSAIKLAKLPTAAKKAKPFSLSATMTSITGTNVVGQKLSLQVLEGKSWVTKQTRNTNSSGKAVFSLKLNSKREYKFRVLTYSYSGFYSIKSNEAKTKVS